MTASKSTPNTEVKLSDRADARVACILTNRLRSVAEELFSEAHDLEHAAEDGDVDLDELVDVLEDTIPELEAVHSLATDHAE